MPLAFPLLIALQCGLLPAPPAVTSQAVARPVQVLNSPNNGQRITVSILEEAEAKTVFADLAGRENIPHAAPDGGYARAHKMVRLLDDQGITAAKAWVEGQLYVDSIRFGEMGWGFHVAPLVFVRTGQSVTAQVLDPALFDKPVPLETWKARLLAKPKAKLERVYFTTRFAYDLDQRTDTLSGYAVDALLDMEQTNKHFSKLLFLKGQDGK